MKNKKTPFYPLIVGLMTGAIVALFLSGKIVDLPRGTRDGGIIAATGTTIIILISFILSAILDYLSKRKVSKEASLKS